MTKTTCETAVKRSLASLALVAAAICVGVALAPKAFADGYCASFKGKSESANAYCDRVYHNCKEQCLGTMSGEVECVKVAKENFRLCCDEFHLSVRENGGERENPPRR